jgi:hypothetical protein
LIEQAYLDEVTPNLYPSRNLEHKMVVVIAACTKDPGDVADSVIGYMNESEDVLNLFHSLKEYGMLNEEYLSSFLKYAGAELPELTCRIQQLTNEVIDLESKKRQSLDALAQLSDTLSWYHRNIKINKQILSDLDKKIHQNNTKRSN